VLRVRIDTPVNPHPNPTQPLALVDGVTWSYMA
jgi:hypothetical protein